MGDNSQEDTDFSFPVCAEDLQPVTSYQKYIWLAEKNLHLFADFSSAINNVINVLSLQKSSHFALCITQAGSQWKYKYANMAGRVVLREAINLSQPLTRATHIKAACRPPLPHLLTLSLSFSFPWTSPLLLLLFHPLFKNKSSYPPWIFSLFASHPWSHEVGDLPLKVSF